MSTLQIDKSKTIGTLIYPCDSMRSHILVCDSDSDSGSDSDSDSGSDSDIIIFTRIY